MNKKFWKHYRIFMFSMLIIIILVLSFLWFYLFAYEKSLPVYEAERITSLFQKGKTDKIIKYLAIEGKYNTNNSAQSYLKNVLKDAKITYEKKSGEYKKDKPVYSILNNDEEIAILTLKKSNHKGMLKTSIWEIEKIDYHFTTEPLTIIALKDEKVLVNDIELSVDNIADDKYALEKLENVIKYVDLEPLVKYELTDVYQNAKVEYQSGSYEKDDNTYTYVYPSDENLLNQEKDFLINWCKNYTKYVVNEATFGSISGYVISNSNAYSFLRTVANTNIWLASHTPTKFSDFTFDNMQKYSDNLFSVDIKYDYSFYVNNDLKEYQTSLTLYLVKIDGEWLIADLTT